MPEAQINILKAFSHKEIRSLWGDCSKLLHCLCADYWNVVLFISSFVSGAQASQAVS